MDLRTRYTALVALMTHYIKFAADSLKRLEEEEVSVSCEQLASKEECSVVWKQKRLYVKFTWLIADM